MNKKEAELRFKNPASIYFIQNDFIKNDLNKNDLNKKRR